MLSIVIPTLNEEEHLPRLLASIKSQTVQPSEIIVADAGSKDRTHEIAKQYGARVVQGGMPGPGRNRGAMAANSEFVLFLDADVELRDPKFLEDALKEMQSRPLDLATGDVYPITDAKLDHVLHGLYNRYVRMWGHRFPHAPGFCMLVRRDLHKKIGGFDETVMFCEDHDYAQRAAKVGKFGFLNTKIPTSIRRLDRDGRLNIALKYTLAELHIALLGPIRHDKFNYTFGYKKKRKQKETV